MKIRLNQLSIEFLNTVQLVGLIAIAVVLIGCGDDDGGGGETSTGTTGPSCTAVDEVCDGEDNDCDGVMDEGVKNACGGCMTLSEAPGGSCGDCGEGTLECDGVEAVTCMGAQGTMNVCGTCGDIPPEGCGVCGDGVTSGDEECDEEMRDPDEDRKDRTGQDEDRDGAGT